MAYLTLPSHKHMAMVKITHYNTFPLFTPRIAFCSFTSSFLWLDYDKLFLLLIKSHISKRNLPILNLFSISHGCSHIRNKTKILYYHRRCVPLFVQRMASCITAPFVKTTLPDLRRFVMKQYFSRTVYCLSRLRDVAPPFVGHFSANSRSRPRVGYI